MCKHHSNTNSTRESREEIPSRFEQEEVEAYVLERPLYRPPTTIWTVLLHFILFLCLCGVWVWLWGWKIGLCVSGGLAILISRWWLIGLIRLYQHYAPEAVRRRCLLKPTCSEYGIQAIKKYGPIWGGWKITYRLFHTCTGFYYREDPLD